MIRSTTCFICVAIMPLPPSTELPGAKASTSGQKSAALGSVRPWDIFRPRPKSGCPTQQVDGASGSPTTGCEIVCGAAVGARGADRAPHLIRRRRHLDPFDAVGLQRVEDCVDDCRRRADAAGFAGALDAERVGL